MNLESMHCVCLSKYILIFVNSDVIKLLYFECNRAFLMRMLDNDVCVCV